MRRLLALLVVLGAAVPAAAQYVNPAPLPVGGPVTSLFTNATVSASGSATFINVAGVEVDVTYGAYGTFSGTSPSIQFCAQPIDQQNTAKASSELAQVCSAVITSATSKANTLRLSPLGSSAVVVSWVMTGTSVGGVDLTVAAKPSSTAPTANSASVSTACCCGTSATACPASPLSGRLGALLVNQGPATVCIGGSGVVAPSSGSCTNGVPLAAGASLSEGTGPGLGDFCAAASAQASPACVVIREVQ